MQKKTSPTLFEEWKAQENPKDWNDLPSSPIKQELKEEGIKYYSKFELRAELLDEQGHICCYCNNKIVNDHNTIIDHVLPKEGNNNQHLIFDYNNLSASCKGGQKDPKPRELHCDAKKENDIIPFSHLDEPRLSEITFDIDGGISSTSDDARQVIKRLNLNIAKLRNLREAALSGFMYEDIEQSVPVSSTDLVIVLEKIRDKEDGQYIAFQSAVEFVLERLV
ncbi:MAG: retron system putative HNH endonuclease [Cyanobacteria bacterium J06649_11]